MNRMLNGSANRLPWVDIFSGSCLSGEMRRIRIQKSRRNVICRSKETSKIGSLVVGPNAIARVDGGNGDDPVVLAPKTVLDDFARIARGRGELRLVVEAAKG